MDVLYYLIGGLIFACGGYLTAWLIAPYRPNPEKLSSYECGEESYGQAWGQYNIRFYVMALIFIVFETELILLFPWITIFENPVLKAQIPGISLYTMIEVLIFLGVLALGLAYIWVNGDIDWIRPEPVIPQVATKIPASEYETLNQQQLHHHSQRNRAALNANSVQTTTSPDSLPSPDSL
jgi:NADH-quinone oxidoreductase subunit A